MYDLSIGNKSAAKKIVDTFSFKKPNISPTIKFEGPNREIIDSYYWIFNFAYYTGKGFTTLKLEDYHYFSENNQFGAQIRQMKGGSIQAFQQNLQQLIQLVKVNLFPLLKEVKQADFYHKWISKIEDSDEEIHKELKKSNPNEKKLKELRGERDEAISHLKDEWVTKVDGGKLWAINRPQSEQGLDYSLLPQLFFGTSIDDPLERKSTLKEQLDKTIYAVDISEGAKEQVARFLYRFYTWLPSAIKDTRVTFKMKVATLKQFYSQIEMYMEFMRPLLIEISKKKEGFDKESIYHGHEEENHLFANLIDMSYSFIRTIGICGFALHDRGDKHNIADLNFTRFGLYIDKSWGDIWSGPAKEKSGFIFNEKNKKYTFVETGKKDVTIEEFKSAKRYEIDKKDIKVWSCMELCFRQRRRNELKQTPQGMAQIPFIQNEINFKGYCWNIVEIAAHREKLRAKDLEILESFIAEISEIKDDLLTYVADLSPLDDLLGEEKKEKKSKKENKEDEDDEDKYKLIFGPFKGLYDIFKPLVSDLSFPGFKGDIKEPSNKHPMDKKIQTTEMKVLEDTWKVYSVHKKANQFMQY